MISLSVKTIHGQKYLYANDFIYLNKGIHIFKNKSLGRPGSSTNRAEILSRFKLEIEKLETEKRTLYWLPKTLHKKAFLYCSVKKLEALRTKLYRGKENLGPEGNRAMETAFIIDFIYNSNKIEGSRLPQKQVTQFVREGSHGKNNEVANTIKAIDYFNGETAPFSFLKLKKGQKILLAQEPDKHGFRKDPFLAGNAPVLEPEAIEKHLKSLFDWYKKNAGKLYPPELAFLFHYRFERIHPFPDGNGRVGRILMNWILKRHKYHPIIVWDNRRRAYFSAFEKAMEGNVDSYLRFMFEQYIKTYEIYLKKLTPTVSFDEQLKHFLTLVP
ncbi:MAG: Fic family protein [Candidatus Gracilibacteria bacterium]